MIAKYKGKFDHGWDKQRELTHAKQLEMGIIPKGTKLTPRIKEIPSWDSRSADEKKVYTRLMENYAAFMDYTDAEVGRLIESLRTSGELDNTLVMYVVGDNGASDEGGLEGTFSEIASLIGVQLGLESTIKRIDEIGGPTSEPHVPVGWAWATNRAIYHDGWVACSQYGLPWQTAGRGDGFLTAPWELYKINEDFSQANDLAAKMPEKLKELQTRFIEEAKKYDVFPLDPRFSERFDPKLRESGEPKTKWTYFGNNVWLPEPIGPQLFPRAHTITAELEIPRGGAEGVVTCAGAFSCGWSLYIQDGKPVFHYNAFEISELTLVGTVAISGGKVTLKTEFTPDGTKEGGGSVTLSVDGKPAGEGKITRTFFRHGLEPFEVGRDTITPVDTAYHEEGEFEFTGKIEKVTFELK